MYTKGRFNGIATQNKKSHFIPKLRLKFFLCAKSTLTLELCLHGSTLRFIADNSDDAGREKKIIFFLQTRQHEHKKKTHFIYLTIKIYKLSKFLQLMKIPLKHLDTLINDCYDLSRL